MSENTINVLIVEDNPADARLIVEMLKDRSAPSFKLSHADRLDAALKMLEKKGFDVVLLDLGLPDSEGLAGLERITARDRSIPVIVLTGMDDEKVGIEALQKNASDYLIKGRINEHLLRRSVQYAIERKRIEETLRESEERFRTLTENVPDMITRFDRDLKLLYANSAVVRRTGLPLKALLGRTAGEYGAVPAAAAQWERTAREVLDSGEPRRLEHTSNWQGETRVLDALLVPERDAGGAVQSVIAIARDVTERKQAEEALRQSEERFRGLAENTPVHVAVARIPDGAILYANRGFEKLYGYAPGELLGKKTLDLYADPAERATVLEELRKQGSLHDREVRSRRMDGSDVWVSISVSRATFEGSEAYIISSLDLTERRRAEKALRESQRQNEFLAGVIESSSQPFAVGYPDGRVGLTNKAYEQLTGYSGDEMRSIDWARALTPPEWREVERKKLEELNETGLPVRYEKEYIRKDGTRVPIELLVHLLKDADGRPLLYHSFLTDITERRRTEDNLRYQASMLEAVNDAIVASDLSFSIRYWNKAAEKLYGWKVEEVLGKPSQDVLRSEISQEHRAAIYKKLQAGNQVSTELVQLTKDGRRLVTAGYTIPLRDSQGKIASYVAINRDITERKRAEEALRESEEKFRRIVETANEGVWTTDAAGKTIFVNQRLAAMLGYGADEMIGRVAWEFLGDDQEQVASTIRGELQTGARTQQEFKFRRKDGSELWAISSASPVIDAEGRHRGTISMLTDITERKRAEEEISRSRIWLERIAGTTPDIIFVLDIVRNLSVYANKSLIEMLGYSPEEIRELGDLLKAAIEPEDLPMVAEFYRKMTDTKPGEVRVLTHRALHKDGRTLWLENRVTPFSWDESGGLVEVIGISHDVTDLKRAHEVLQRDRETFERLVDERTAELMEIHHELDKARHLSDIGMLASTVAHELRNPLSVIKTAVYNINRKKQGDALDRHLHTINKKIDESNQIITNLLMYARIKQPAYETVRIRDLLHESIESAKARSEGRPVTFLDECGPVENVTATLDPTQISEVMGNILTNAAQAIPPEGGGSVTVSARVSDGILHIRVRDTGIGIDPDILPHVFEPFFTSKSKGTGLGLSLCKELVSLHNGSIDIESEPGKGTAVLIILPLSPEIHPATT